MRHMPLLFLLLLAAALTSGACGSAPPAAPLDPLPTPTYPPLPSNAAGQRLVARVNSVDVLLTRFEREYARAARSSAAADPLTLRAWVLDALIEQELIRQAAAALQIAVTPAEVEAEVQANRAIAGGNWDSWLADNLYTDEEFRAMIADTLLTSRVRDVVTQGVGGAVPQARARHILVATADDAQAVLDRLAAGEDFAALALALSADVSTRDVGGDLGWFTIEGLLQPALAQAAFSQPLGDYGIVQTNLGFHVLQVLERADRPVEADSLADVAQARFESWLRDLLDTAVIERFI